jgi:hypothetical protein
VAPAARFRNASISITAPKLIPKKPAASTMCGGLMIFTSRPYALCHQSSNGADASMAAPPQAQTNAPIGPDKPQMRTLTSRSDAALLNVVVKMRYAADTLARTPHA